MVETRVVPYADDVAVVASDALLSGAIAILPCDTIYGLCGCVPDAENRLRAIKGRDENRPFIVLISDVESVSRFSVQTIDPRLLALWPGPMTYIVRARGGGTVAIRLPASEFLREIMQSSGPLYSTSVNRSGFPALSSIECIVREFSGAVELIVDAGDLPAAAPSTVVDLTLPVPTVVRHGAGRLPADFT